MKIEDLRAQLGMVEATAAPGAAPADRAALGGRSSPRASRWADLAARQPNGRRTALECALAQCVQVDQRWRQRTSREVWIVRQVHRHDCQVTMRSSSAIQSVSFEELADGYIWMAPADLVIGSARSTGDRS